jgi:hypothetical protein
VKHVPPACGIWVAAVLIILLGAAGPALAADLPLVSSTTYASALDDGFTCATTDAGGAVYAAGYTQRNEAGTRGQFILVKYIDDGSGPAKVWQATGGSPWSAAAVAVDPLGNVVVAVNKGRLTDFHGNGGDIRVLKYSPEGKLDWIGMYDGPAHGLDYVKAMAIDVHGNVIVCGSSFGHGTGRDFVTLKFRAANGALVWARRYAGPSDFDEARDLTVDPSGNVYVTGQSRSKASKPGISGPPGMVTVAYTAGGKQRWIVVDRRRLAVTGQAIDYTGADGVKSVVLTGARTPAGSKERAFFAKYRTDGKLLWTTSLDPAVYASGWGMAAALCADGAPVAAGLGNTDGETGGWLAGVSATGGSPWTSTIASLYDNPSWAEFDSVTVASDGRILAAGNIGSGELAELDDIPTTYLVRYSPGRPITAPLDYTGGGGATTFNECAATAIGDKGMYAVGKAAEGAGDSDAVLLKF